MSREHFYCLSILLGLLDIKRKGKSSVSECILEFNDLMTGKVRRNKLQISLDYYVESSLCLV